MTGTGISRRWFGGAALGLGAVVAVWAVIHIGAGRAAAQDAPTVQIGDGGALGAILTGSNGMTLYTFDRDQPGVSNCTGRCAETWPPLVLDEGDPTGPAGLTGTLAVIARADGLRQVAYNDQPLYFYAGDANPGDTTGEGVGGVWHVARP